MSFNGESNIDNQAIFSNFAKTSSDVFLKDFEHRWGKTVLHNRAFENIDFCRIPLNLYYSFINQNNMRLLELNYINGRILYCEQISMKGKF